MDTTLRYILDFIGVIAFSISGALVGVRKKMDYLGVCIMGIITAVGGGAIRDITIGRTPPAMFSSPVFVGVAFVVANIVFFFMYTHANLRSRPKVSHFFEEAMFWFDTVGLAAFTTDGVLVGMNLTSGGLFLCSFLGVITGVGGGILRDLLAMEVPAIFKKHVYAMASIAGSIVTCLLWRVIPPVAAVSVGMALIFLIRVLAKHFEWNLLRIK